MLVFRGNIPVVSESVTLPPLKRILGVDPSTKTGFAGFLGSTSTFRYLLKLTQVSPKFAKWDRLRQLEEGVEAVLMSFRPTHVYCEAYSTHQKSSIATCVEIGTLLRRAIVRLNIPLYSVPPMTLKKWASGKGNADKEAMIAAVFKRWKIQFQSDDLADAYALGRLGIAHQMGESIHGVINEYQPK